MTRYCFVVYSNPVKGREDEYNKWYDDQHLADVLAVPGFVAAQRFRIAKDDPKVAHRYLAIYEIETVNLKETLKEMYSRTRTDAMPISSALDMDGVSTAVYEAIGGRRVR